MAFISGAASHVCRAPACKVTPWSAVTAFIQGLTFPWDTLRSLERAILSSKSPRVIVHFKFAPEYLSLFVPSSRSQLFFFLLVGWGEREKIC
jgi:hypothetical protein